MAQDAVDRWYWPSLMMFGPPDDESPNSAQSMAWKIKRFSNDELRQRFIGMLVPQAAVLGVTLPDPEPALRRGDRRWHTSEIDWTEFHEVLSGRGPMNASASGRTAATAHEDGAWVREAAVGVRPEAAGRVPVAERAKRGGNARRRRRRPRS